MKPRKPRSKYHRAWEMGDDWYRIYGAEVFRGTAVAKELIEWLTRVIAYLESKERGK